MAVLEFFVLSHAGKTSESEQQRSVTVSPCSMALNGILESDTRFEIVQLQPGKVLVGVEVTDPPEGMGRRDYSKLSDKASEKVSWPCFSVRESPIESMVTSSERIGTFSNSEREN